MCQNLDLHGAIQALRLIENFLITDEHQTRSCLSGNLGYVAPAYSVAVLFEGNGSTRGTGNDRRRYTMANQGLGAWESTLAEWCYRVS